MRHTSYALLVLAAAVVAGCTHDEGVSFDPRVSRETLPSRHSSRHPCVETPARPRHASLKTPVFAEPAFQGTGNEARFHYGLSC